MTSKVALSFSNQLIFCLMIEEGYTWIEFYMLIHKIRVCEVAHI